MGNRIGIIAGSGEIPSLVMEEACNLGYSCVVAAVKGAAEKSLEKKAQILEWFDADEIARVAAFFKESEVREAVFAGKVEHRMIFGNKNLAEKVLRLEDKTPSTLLIAAIDYMAREGIEIKNPMMFLSSSLCDEGILTETKPSEETEEDINFGWRIAKLMADLDVGQTIVVKDKAVVAVEGMEGTDEVIRRGGKLAGEGTVVIKVARTRQDFRIDMPAVGLQTIKSLVEAGCCALCFEAGKTAFFQQKEAISMADAHKISIIARK